MSGLFFETVVGLIVLYVPPFNIAFSTRPIAPHHFVIPAMIYFTMMISIDEVRRIFVRNGTSKSKITGRVVYEGWFAQNTVW
jgi:hypothetical protein